MSANTKSIVKYNIVKEKTALFLPSTQITGAEDAAKVSKLVHDAEGDGIREYFILIFLNRNNRPTGYQIASIGGACQAIVDTPLICRAAILSDCRSVIATHNHPGGNTQPSEGDRKVTTSIKQALKICGIELIDHIITTEENGYFSFAEEGIL